MIDSELEIAYLAGLFSGEGSIVFQQRASVKLALAMTDQDEVERCQRAFGCGRLHEKTPRFSHYKVQYSWEVHAKTDVIDVLEKMLPYLGERRRVRAVAALERLESNRGWHGTHCSSGHEYTEANTYVSGGFRKCRTCVLGRQRAYRARNRERLNSAALAYYHAKKAEAIAA